MEKRRVLSLDAFRGYTIAAMLLVNFPGSWDHVYFQLQHTAWNGLSFTDLIAPFFLFIVGVSISFSYSKIKDGNGSKRSIYKKIIIRSLKIFAVGMFLNLMPFFNLNEIRWTGTLHRIAIVFLASSFIFLHTNWKQQIIIAGGILILYWIVMLTIPTPGVGQVVLEPGRNIAAWVDSKLLPGKMYQGTWDPEGILSTFPSIATCILGMLAGTLLQTNLSDSMKINYLLSFGVIVAIAGFFAGLSFPLNENLWSSSFVLVTAGFAALVLGAMYFRMDILNNKSGSAAGVIFGSNAITVYVLGDVLSLFFYGIKLGGHSLNEHVVNLLINHSVSPKLASMLYALFFVCINFIPAYILYKKKIFIKL